MIAERGKNVTSNLCCGVHKNLWKGECNCKLVAECKLVHHTCNVATANAVYLQTVRPRVKKTCRTAEKAHL